ncbi:hypothetical protein [Aureimonas sp. AU4]|uniref:hypothetical protein n=1 Tax=Aureimonas sp. AU4 TaxID=1638163 RepID=UPI0007858F74|nr:hypothetical protein [Aureimonas sp. AU4]
MPKTLDDRRRAVMERLGSEGLEAAADAAISVCRDPKAPAPARATAAGLIFRATALGGFGKEEDEGLDKEAHEMSPEETRRALARLQRKLAEEDGEADETVFG